MPRQFKADRTEETTRGERPAAPARPRFPRMRASRRWRRAAPGCRRTRRSSALPIPAPRLPAPPWSSASPRTNPRRDPRRGSRTAAPR